MPSQMDMWNKSNPFQRLVLAQHIPNPELHPTQMELKVWCVAFHRDPSPRILKENRFFFLATGNKYKLKLLLLLCGRCTQKKASILCQRVCTVAESCSGVLTLTAQLVRKMGSEHEEKGTLFTMHSIITRCYYLLLPTAPGLCEEKEKA